MKRGILKAARTRIARTAAAPGARAGSGKLSWRKSVAYQHKAESKSKIMKMKIMAAKSHQRKWRQRHLGEENMAKA
jgi:hypothetical protein